MDTKRIQITGPAISVRGNDIDTDRIIPARFLRCVTFDDLAGHAFEDDRSALKAKGQTHNFDRPEFANARILFVNKNFGCGSSREHAPQALMRWGQGIQAIIGESFAEIFFGNCVSLGIPCATTDEKTLHELQDANAADPAAELTFDVENRVLHGYGKETPIHIPDGPRMQFLQGRWDSTAELLEAREEIAKTASQVPYFGHWK